MPLPVDEAANYQLDFSISDTSAKEFMLSACHLCLSVCLLFVWLFVCKQGYSKTTDQMFMKFYGMIRPNP